MMRSFFIGATGASLVLLFVAIALPLYSGYTDRVASSEMLMSVRGLQKGIETHLLKYKSTEVPIPSSDELSSHIAYIKVFGSGVILIKGKEGGQIMILEPAVGDDKVVKWKCLGAPNKLVPLVCRGLKL